MTRIDKVFVDLFSCTRILYLIIAIITIAIACSKETISDKTGLNHIDDVSAKIDDYDLSHLLNEGFLLISNNRKKSVDSSVVDRNSKLNGALSTTCKTITGIDAKNQTSIDNGDEIDRFWKVDDEQLSEELINIEVAIDGSGDTTEPTSETTAVFTEPITSEKITTSLTSMLSSISTTITTAHSTIAPTEIVLSGYSIFLITVDCANASAILNDILNQFNRTFPYWYNVTNNLNSTCPRSLTTEISFTFFTDNNITVLTNLFQILENIVSNMGIELRTFNRCGRQETNIVKDVTSCYLIDLCSLCGTNPPRGVCFPEKNVSKCQCLANENNPSIFYVGEFCTIPKENEVTSTLASWVAIVVGILAGLAGLFCIIIICYLIKFIYRRRSQKSKNSEQDEMRLGPQWYLPRVRIPTSANDRSKTTFQEFDPKMGESDVALINNYYDPIDELDAIVDYQDIDMTLRQ